MPRSVEKPETAAAVVKRTKKERLILLTRRNRLREILLSVLYGSVSAAISKSLGDTRDGGRDHADRGSVLLRAAPK